MRESDVSDLCFKLLRAESEAEVIEILTARGLWSDPDLWRHYGDVENNWGQGGNQQSLAEAALAEKLVNSVDARLINQCWMNGVNPKSPEAPRGIREAVSRFFEGGTGKKIATGGYIEEWSSEEIREAAQGITLCATGAKPSLNLTVSDSGEGQAPDRLPETILSLSRSNKMYIPFVQGQYNQGGAGALRFCGSHNIQFVLSRRNPALLGADHSPRDEKWGFTIVRRERPSQTGDGRRNSIYTFLAPVGVGDDKEPRRGGILAFSADKLPIFPSVDQPYGRDASYGTAIKLFDYQYVGDRSNIIRGKRSVLRRLELLLPEIGLPVRLHEFRRTSTGQLPAQASRETTLVGLRRRLNDNENVETGFPVVIPFSPKGENLRAEVYAFRPEGSERDGDEDDDDVKGRKRLGGIKSYRKNEGVVFVRNGQTQGSLPRDYFKRESLKLRPIADDLLVFVYCDQMSDDVREDLFMPSRDRMSDTAFKSDLVGSLDQALRQSEPLKSLRNRRQQERMAERLRDDKPLTEVLQSLIKSSPNLSQLLHLGERISSPFNTVAVGQSDEEFRGEVYPTYFKLKGVEYGDVGKRSVPVNQRMKLTFETDARDDYFSRRIERGEFTLSVKLADGVEEAASSVGPSLGRGIATVMVMLPDSAAPGDQLNFSATVKDSRDAFFNSIEVSVREPATRHQGGGGSRQTPQQKSGNDREMPRQLAMPTIHRIYRDEWDAQSPPFDENTAMTAQVAGYDGEDEADIYEFRVNMDNTPLLNEIKLRRLDEVSAKNQFLYGNVLIGLSLILSEKTARNARRADESADFEGRVDATCRALAPFMLALTSLGQADLSDGDDVDGLEVATG